MQLRRVMFITVLLLAFVLLPVWAQTSPPPLPTDLDTGLVLLPQADYFGSVDANSTTLYVFYARRGDAISLAMRQLSGDLVPYLELREAPETPALATQAADDLAGRTAALRFEPVWDGWYYITAGHDPAAGTTASGDYRLRLTGAPTAIYNLLGYDDLPTLNEDDLVLLQTRNIQLESGQTYYIPVQAGEQLTLDPPEGVSLRLYDLTGTRVAQNEEVNGYISDHKQWLRLDAHRSREDEAAVNGAVNTTPVATIGGVLSSFVTPTASPTVTATFTVTPSNTPTLTPTLRPSSTPTETLPPLSLADTQIVYTCFIDGIDQICVMNGDGSNQRQLTAYRATSWYGSIFEDRIFYSSMRSGSFEIYSMNLDGSDDLRLTTNADGYAPALSPDGSQIAFAAQQENADQDIYVMNADGTNPRRLTFEGGEEVDPIWSPDGRQILFSSNRYGTRQLFTMNLDGSNWRQITTTGQNGRSDWSPDGRYITYYAGSRGAEAIYIANSDGSDARLLTPYDGSKAPSFSPDSNWITFASTRDGDLDVYVMRNDGSLVAQLTFNAYSEWQPRWER